MAHANPVPRLAAVFLLLLAGSAASAQSPWAFHPREVLSPPVNGTDALETPAYLTEVLGFSSRDGSKLVEHGDTTIFLDELQHLAGPHLDWAAPYARGPVRVLYPVNPGRGPVLRDPFELRQRSGFTFHLLQVPSILGDSPSPALQLYLRDRAFAALEADYDVIVLNRAVFALGEDFLDALLQRVEAGVGCVVVHDAAPWWRVREDLLERLYAVSPLRFGYGGNTARPQRTEVFSPVTAGLSFAAWPPTSVHNSTAAEGAEVLATLADRPLVATGAYGRGRVIGVYFFTAGLLPTVDLEEHPLFGDYYEPVYAFWLRALAWAAGREPRLALDLPETLPAAAGQPLSVPFTLRADPPAGSVTLSYRLTDHLGALCTEGRRSFRVGAATPELQLDLPPLYASGRYRLDLWVLSGREVENWGYTLLEVAGALPFSAAPPQASVLPHETATYRLSTGGAAGELLVVAVDDADRVFYTQRQPARDGQAVRVPVTRSLLPRNRVEFTLYQGDRVVGRDAHELWVPRIGLESAGSEYVVASYGWTSAAPHLAPLLGDLYRAAGFNAIYGNWHSRGYIAEHARLGLFSISGAMSPYLKQSNFEPELENCPNKPSTREEWLKHITQAKDDIRHYGGLGRVLDDEAFFGYTAYHEGQMRGAQVCQCSWCLDQFREKMRAKYGDIQALNRAWDTAFPSFEELRPLEEHEVVGGENPSGWLEFRQFANWVYANQYYGWIQSQHEDLSPTYGVGAGAPGWTTRGNPTYRGGDMTTLKPVLRFLMAYGGDTGRLLDTAYVGEPGAQKYDPPLWWQQWGPWQQLFWGADALWYYYGHALIGNEIAWRRHAQWVLQGLADIRDGLGTLVSDARPLDRDIRILYSPESMALQWLNAKAPDARRALGQDRSTATFLSLFRNFLFLQPSYVTAAEIQAGALSDCRLLLLPLATNLDDATAEAIREYVAAGGTVVADLLPATHEQFGRPRERSLLQDVFGVDETAATLHQEPESWYSVGIYPDRADLVSSVVWLPADVSMPGMRPTTATAAGQVLSRQGQEAPACFVNSFGQGRALLLNFVYRDLDPETSGWHLLFGRALLDWAGLRPPARLLDPATGAPLPYRPLYAYRSGPATLLGSIRGRSLWSGDRPVLIDDGRALDLIDQARFVWEEPAHIYDLRRREYLGHAAEATLSLPSFEGRLLSLLPYRVTGVSVPAPSSARAGEDLRLEAAVQAADARVGSHLLRLEVYSPTGYRNPLYCRTVAAPAGRAQLTVPFAHNDRPGAWRLVVRDVLSGVENEVRVRLAP